MESEDKAKKTPRIIIKAKNDNTEFNDNILESAKNIASSDREPAKKSKPSKKNLTFLIIGIACLCGGIASLLVAILTPKAEIAELHFPTIPSKQPENNIIYSKLTGLPLAEGQAVNAPTFCIQIPNGTDGARPQAGLTAAGVIYEAIAEAGITRFDAVFQAPTSAVIGPIRSLRTYYLDFATPFGCTVVHAGGAGDALAELNSGGYRDLDENYQYMYRSNLGGRLWNNLFTTATDLQQFNSDRGYESSEVQGLNRMTPTESNKARIDALATHKLSITASSDGNTSELVPKVNQMSFSFASAPSFDVHYIYNADNNNYLRSYQTGAAHEVYECPNENLGEPSPESVCTLTNLSPSVVIAMIVAEKRAADNYHEDITMIGTGDAYIFQNGTVVKGSWSKSSRSDQIKFFNESGEEVKLAPGQTFISAVPQYGSVEY